MSIDYTGTPLPVGSYTGQITVSSVQATNSPQKITVHLTVRNIPGDINGDDDVDLEDFAHFQICYTHPGGGITPGCENANLDGRSGIDQSDFLLFQPCLSGTGILANPACAE
jgi:hypothetical protein